MLARDRVAVVRTAAAALLASTAGAAEKKALERCAAEDEDAEVAASCASAPSSIPSASEPVLVYVVPAGETEAVPGAPFVLHLADGSYRLGLADRRGAVSESAAPKGEIELGITGPLSE
jgi:hypothetical protein